MVNYTNTWLCLRVFALALVCGTWLVASSPTFGQDPMDLPNDSSFTRLGDAKIADALKLTDEQRGKVASLITARAEALAKAAAADRPAVTAQFEKDLDAVLNDQQRTQFAKETAPARLRFNFRFTKWSDVLEWYSKQANLSLILDAPPPGTFNYTDTKTYSTVEALDLLNGVLSTKGYTLIRRGGMLLVIDIQEGIPEELIPRIPKEELDKRGKFELVSVLFPLGARDPQAVKTEITPLLSPFGKSVLLPSTKQILVTDTAGIVRAINATISSISEPAAATPAATPVYGVYPLKGVDPKVAEDVLSKMFASARIAADVKADQLNAYASPNEQKAIQGIIERMQAQDPPEKKPRLEVYPIGNADASQLVTNMQLVAPTARITFDSRERKLVVFASPLDQTNVQTALEKLAVSGPADTSRQLEVYRLSKADPSSAYTLLVGMLPQVKFTLDPQTRRIIAIASPDDHKSIKAILDQIQSTEAGPDTQTIQFYPSDVPLPTSTMTVLNTIAPKALISFNPETKQLQIFASPADQANIKANLDEIQKGTPAPEKRQMAVYRVTPAQRSRFNTALPSLTTDLPDIRVVPEGAEPSELAIWAKPSQHEVLKKLIDSLSTENTQGAKPQLMTHHVRFADASTAITTLKTLTPDAKITLDGSNRTLVVYGTPADQEIVRTTLEKLQPGDLGRDAPLLRFYPLEQALPPNTLSAFNRLVPKATIVTDTDGKTLQVVASQGDHEAFKRHLDEILATLPQTEKRKLVVYPSTLAQRTRFQSILPSLNLDFPDVRVIPDTSGSNDMAVWAKPTQHEQLKKLIESLANEPTDADSQLVNHPLRSVDYTTASNVLKTLVPDAKITVDSVNRNLAAIASPADQAIIKSTLEKLQPGDLGPDAPLVRYYPLENPLPPSVLTVFTKIAPKATVTADPDGKWLQVVGTEADHALIKSNLDKELKALPLLEKRKLTVYTVSPAQRTRFQTLLPSLSTDLPEIRVSDGGPNELAIWAKPAQHEVLKNILEELKREAPANERNRLIAYPLKFADPATSSIMLQTLFPGAKINVDTNTNRLLIWTRPDDHTAIKQAIEELDSESVGEKRDQVMVYPAKDFDPDAAISLLQGVLQNRARLAKDPKARTIVAWAKRADHEVIAKTLASMKASTEGNQKAHLKIYPAGKVNAASMVQVLAVTFPYARIAVDVKTGGLVAYGTPDEQAEIKSAIDQMMAQAIGETGKFVTYRLFKTERETVQAVLKQAAPEAQVSSSRDPTQLLIWARPEDHVNIERIINELESTASPNKNFELKIYSLKAVSAAIAQPIIGRAVPKAMVNPSTDPYRLVIFAMPSDHEVIEKLIKQIDAEHAPDNVVEFYDVQKLDTDAALRLVQAILQRHSAGTTVAFIPGTNQLYVEARPEQHELIRSGLMRLRTSGEFVFEVFQLETVEAFNAESMIRRIFSNQKTTPPVVESDAASQKLYVRGTKEQITRIRDMLEKMGESKLGASGENPTRRVRTIPFGGDPYSAIKEIEQIWPKLRSNEIRVIPMPGGSKLNLLQQPPKDLDDGPLKKLIQPNTSNEAPEANRDQSLPEIPNEGDDNQEEQADEPPTPSFDEAVERQTQYDSKEKKSSSKVEKATKHQLAAAQNGDKTPEPADKGASSPIVIMPKDGSITILSEDAEALDQLDKLLRALSLPTETGGRAFAVFALKYASATSVADTIRQALRIQSGQSNSRTGFTAPTVVADERLNAIVIHANRTDRLAIERLIEALDSSDIPDALSANRPRRINIKNGSAVQIEKVLRLVYRQQLSAGGGAKPLPIPGGLSPEVAAMLQMINSANTGPLLSLTVDEVTNSIIIMAPNSLTEQVVKMIEELDEASLNENSQGMNIMSTKRMSSSRAKKILDQILDKSKRVPR